MSILKALRTKIIQTQYVRLAYISGCEPGVTCLKAGKYWPNRAHTHTHRWCFERARSRICMCALCSRNTVVALEASQRRTLACGTNEQPTKKFEKKNTQKLCSGHCRSRRQHFTNTYTLRLLRSLMRPICDMHAFCISVEPNETTKYSQTYIGERHLWIFFGRGSV